MIDPRVRLIYYLLLDDDEGNSSIAMLRDEEVWIEYRKNIKKVDISLDDFETTAWIISQVLVRDLLDEQ